MVKDAQDAVGDDIMMVETRAETQELSCPEEETHLGNKDSPQFNGTQTGKEGSFQFEDAEVENKECLIPDHNVATDKLYTETDPIHPDNSLKEQALIEPSVVISVQPVVDPDIGSNTNVPQGNDDKTDGKHLVPLIQSDSVVLSEMSLDTQAEDEMEQELKNGLSGMELDPDITTTKDDLNNGERGTHLPPEHGTEDKALNNEMCGLELLPGNETKDEELNVGATEMELELPLDIETKVELQNVVSGSDLPLDNEIKEESNNAVTGIEVLADNEIKEELPKLDLDVGDAVDVKSSNKSFLLEPNASGGGESGTEVEQAAFMKELEIFHKERCLEFKPPRFYGEPLNCLKLWRAVVRLGGYEQVTACKLWRQVGESFKPPKTCTTVSWTFRCFYEKALLEYEKHKMRSGELPFTDASFTEPMSAGNQPGLLQASGSGRARRDAAARAMQGWHSQRLLGNGEVGDPIIKDKNSVPTPKREKHLKSIGLLKRKKASPVERAVKAARLKASKPQPVTMVVDIGPPADWVKVNVQRTKDCFEVYALVPGLLREEVRVQSDPVGRLVISGQPEQLDNPWGVTPFKKVVSLPSRIDPHQTSAVVTLHGQLFVRVPFEQSDL